MDADLDTLATAPYVRTDDLLKTFPEHAPARPRVGIAPRLTDAELVTLAVIQALLAGPARPAGCEPTPSCALCSPTCPNSRAATSGCARWPGADRRPRRQTVIADRVYYGRQFEATLTGVGIQLLRPARAGEPSRPGARFFQPLRQVIESINDTVKGQLDLEQHAGHTPTGVWVRVLQRVLALTAAIWHNDHIGAPTPRSLIGYDH